jgi:hypothetical protein
MRGLIEKINETTRFLRRDVLKPRNSDLLNKAGVITGYIAADLADAHSGGLAALIVAGFAGLTGKIVADEAKARHNDATCTRFLTDVGYDRDGSRHEIYITGPQRSVNLLVNTQALFDERTAAFADDLTLPAFAMKRLTPYFADAARAAREVMAASHFMYGGVLPLKIHPLAKIPLMRHVALGDAFVSKAVTVLPVARPKLA